jgi:hypothetical protein
MGTKCKGGLALLAAVVFGVGVGLTLNRLPAAHGNAEQGGKPANVNPHYTVVETEGHNLLVTDNQTNTLYFYTVDKGAEIGSELKLRGSVDLNQVGKDGITPKRHQLPK